MHYFLEDIVIIKTTKLDPYGVDDMVRLRPTIYSLRCPPTGVIRMRELYSLYFSQSGSCVADWKAIEAYLRLQYWELRGVVSLPIRTVTPRLHIWGVGAPMTCVVCGIVVPSCKEHHDHHRTVEKLFTPRASRVQG